MANAYGDATIIGQRSGVTYDALGLANQAALDTLIVELNERASAEVETYTGRDFINHAAAVELYDGTDDAYLDLRGWPVQSVASVKEDGVLLAATGYRLLPGRGGLNAPGILEIKDNVWTKDWEKWEVTYTWGYAMEAPLEVRRVVEDMVIRVLQGAKADVKATGAQSISMDGFSVTYDRASLAPGLNADDKRILQAHKVPRIGGGLLFT